MRLEPNRSSDQTHVSEDLEKDCDKLYHGTWCTGLVSNLISPDYNSVVLQYTKPLGSQSKYFTI